LALAICGCSVESVKIINLDSTLQSRAVPIPVSTKVKASMCTPANRGQIHSCCTLMPLRPKSSVHDLAFDGARRQGAKLEAQCEPNEIGAYNDLGPAKDDPSSFNLVSADPVPHQRSP
jgi:hypothetical protein